MSADMLPFSFANKHKVLLTSGATGTTLSFTDKTAVQAIAEACRFAPEISDYKKLSQQEIEEQISHTYKDSDSDLQAIDEIYDSAEFTDIDLEDVTNDDLLDSKDDAPVIRMINVLFTQALKQKASDIHIETFEQSMSVRFRVDGVLQEILQPHYRWGPRLISRIKVMAKLDIAEKRVPQDGRVGLRLAGQALDVRVSTLPSIHGERVVLRLLEKQAKQLDLNELGMPLETSQKFKSLLHEPNGIILVTGPTGSGKTTTLYAGLSLLNEKSRNILTIEDPVEYAIAGIGQTPVNTKTGMTFAKGLRAILRQDPDVVMIGEIRDPETAQIAVQASLTGHLVLSTLHTNDALGAITRLVDIGVEPYLIASALKGVMAQRLVRTLCSQCKRPTNLDASLAERLGKASLEGVSCYESVGCNHCNNSGYIGRIGLYELLPITADLAKMIHDRESEQVMLDYVRHHTASMLDEGIALILEGKTSASEVLRMIRDNSGHAVI